MGLGLGVTVGAGVFMATGKASSEAGPVPCRSWKLFHLIIGSPCKSGWWAVTKSPRELY